MSTSHNETRPSSAGTDGEEATEGNEKLKSQSSPPLHICPHEFLARFRSQASEHVKNAYTTERSLRESNNENSLSLSLCDDISYLLEIQSTTLNEYLIQSGLESTADGEDVCIEAVVSILHALYCRQLYYRDSFLTDFETCCAAANDFMSLVERIEDWVANMSKRYPYLGLVQTSAEATTKEIPDLLQLYSKDAVHCVQMAHLISFHAIEESGISTDLFGVEWEESLIQNEVVRSLVSTMADNIADLEDYLGYDLLRKKAMDALIRAAVLFYIRCLIRKAGRVRRWRKEKGAKFHVAAKKRMEDDYCCPFSDAKRAVKRIRDDIYLLKSFFKSWVLQMAEALDRVIEEEFTVLAAVCDCLDDAAGVSEPCNSVEFISIIYKGTGYNGGVTECFVSDLIYLIVSNKDLRKVLIESMRRELVKIQNVEATGEKPPHQVHYSRYRIPGLQLSLVLARELEEDRQLRPEPSSSKGFKPESIKNQLRKSRKKIHKLSAQLDKAKPKQSAKRFIETCEKAAMLKQQQLKSIKNNGA